MTHEEFKEICLREYPKIEGMVKTVKALGVDYVSCNVHANGMINFDIHEKKDRSFHTSWHGSKPKDGNLYILSSMMTTTNHGGRRNAITTMQSTMTALRMTFR